MIQVAENLLHLLKVSPLLIGQILVLPELQKELLDFRLYPKEWIPRLRRWPFAGEGF